MSAHPLGNFTVNRYSELDVAGNRVYVVYVLDLAEIPTFQAGGRQGIHATAYAARIAANLRLEVNGRRAHLIPLRSELAFPPGQGGLTTTRLEVLFEGPLLTRAATLRYHDGNYPGRIGWKEVVVSPSAGAHLSGSTAPDRSVSDRLLAYPKNLLQSPLDVVVGVGRRRAGRVAGRAAVAGIDRVAASSAPAFAPSATRASRG